MMEIEKLSISEKQAIEELRRRIEHDLSPHMLQEENIFYRFLKARDFNLKAAENMLRKHIHDTNFYGVNTILTDYKPPQLLKDYYPVNFLGFDKEGSIVRYIDLGEADHKALVNIWSFHQLVQHNAHFLEEDFQLMREQTKKLRRPITKYCLIINMDGLTLSKATFKKGIEVLMHGFQLFQDNYPERIKSVYAINASFYFNVGYAIVKTCLASALVQKVRIYGKDGWKNDLLEVIDADVLPAFLGGTRTDPDGNPLCNSFIIHGRTIPEELYNKKLKNPLSKENNVKKVTVTRFSSCELMFYVYEPQSHIEWEFETKTRDIGFALYYKDNAIMNPKIVELIPKQRIDTLLGSETGVYKCDKVGTYIITFDNSYSWLHSKEIYYRICLKKPNEIDSHVTES